MKRIVIILSVVFGIGVLISVAGGVAYLVGGGADKNVERKSYETKYENEGLLVNSFADDVEISVIDGDNVVIDYYESDKIKREISVDEGVIAFKTKAERSFFDVNLPGVKDLDLKIGLPKTFSGKVTVKGSVGEVDLSFGDLEIAELNVSLTTGDVELLNANVNGKAYIETSAGGIDIKGLNAKNVEFKATTGSIESERVVAENVKVKITTGSLKKFNAECDTFRAETTTGGVKFEVSAKDIFVKTTTGSINGRVKGKVDDYTVTTSTTTGSCNLTDRVGVTEKKLEARATTGSIKIEFD